MENKPKRGRPSKVEKNTTIAKVLGVEDAGTLLAAFAGETAMSHDLDLEGSLQTRFEALGRAIAKRLREVHDNASRDPNGAAGKWTPWLTGVTPEVQLDELGRRLHLNERVVHHLLQQAATHMALSAKIESAMTQARRAMIDKALKVPAALQQWIVKLHAAGLSAEAVKNMSGSAIDALIAALKGEADPDLLDQLGIAKRSRLVSEEEAERALEESRRMMAEYRSKTWVSEAPPPEEEEIVPEVPPDFAARWDYTTGPLPREYWSAVQEMEIPYRWKYRMATAEEENGVVDMMLPEAHDWAALRAWNRHFKEMTMESLRSQKGGVRNIRDLIGNERDISPDDVDMNLVRTWLLLLVARHMTAAECASMFVPGFFAGLVMPCPATGGSVVRELVRTDE